MAIKEEEEEESNRSEHQHRAANLETASSDHPPGKNGDSLLKSSLFFLFSLKT